MKSSFHLKLLLLFVLGMAFLNIGCTKDTKDTAQTSNSDLKKFTQISSALAAGITQLQKEPGITLTGFSSNPDNNLFKVGIGIDRSITSDELLRKAIDRYLVNAASVTSEHDPQKLLKPYNLQFEEIDKEKNGSRLLAEKPSGTTEIDWKNINETPWQRPQHQNVDIKSFIINGWHQLFGQ